NKKSFLENHGATGRGLLLRSGVPLLVRFETNSTDLWWQSGSLYSKGKLRERETRRSRPRELRTEPGKSDNDGVVREMELFDQLYRRESESGTAKSAGGNRADGAAFKKWFTQL